jgi:hypothetical protein
MWDIGEWARLFSTVREYSLVKEYGDVQLFHQDIEPAIDINGNMQKIQEIAQYLLLSLEFLLL